MKEDHKKGLRSWVGSPRDARDPSKDSKEEEQKRADQETRPGPGA